MVKVPLLAPDAAIGSQRLYQFMKNVDLVGKLSDRLGTSTENLAGFLHAADLGGATQADVVAALERLNMNLAAATRAPLRGGQSGANESTPADFDAAVTGTGRAARALERIGLSPCELAETDNIEAVMLIADALIAIPNETLRAALAAQIFGPAGIALLNTLNLGSAGLAQLHDEAVRLCLTFSRSDAAVVEAANLAWNKAIKVFAGIGNQCAIQFSPLIAAGCNKLRELALSGWSATQTVSIVWAMFVELAAYFADWFQLTGKGLVYLLFVCVAEYVWLVNLVSTGRGSLDRMLKSLLPGAGMRLCTSASGCGPTMESGYALKARCVRSLESPLTAGDNVRRFFTDIREQACREATAATSFRNPAAAIEPPREPEISEHRSSLIPQGELNCDDATPPHAGTVPTLRIFDPAEYSDDHSIELRNQQSQRRNHSQRNRARKRRRARRG